MESANGWYWITRVWVNQGRPAFLCQNSTPVIVGWFAGCTWKISDVRHQLNYCGLRPRVGDSCIKHNCILKRLLGTLQPSRAPLIVNVVSVAVSYCSPYESTVARHVKVENFHHFESLHHVIRILGNLFSALCHIVCVYYARKLGYPYIDRRRILYGSLLVWIVFLCAKIKCFWVLEPDRNVHGLRCLMWHV